MKTFLSVTVLCVLFLTGCANTAQRTKQMQRGMTKAEAVALLGEPERIASPGPKVEILTFIVTQNRFPKVPIDHEYLVRLVNGTVDAYGYRKDFGLDHNVNLKVEP